MLIGELLSETTVLQLESPVATYSLAHALSIHLPVLLTLILTIYKHPVRRTELGHYSQLQAEESKRRHNQEEPGEEGHNVVGRIHVLLVELTEDRSNSSHAFKCTTFESTEGSTVCGRAFWKHAYGVISQTIDFDLTLTFFNLLNYLVSRLSIFPSVNEQALEPDAKCVQSTDILEVGLWTETWMKWSAQ